jgi:hypothetical protein
MHHQKASSSPVCSVIRIWVSQIEGQMESAGITSARQPSSPQACAGAGAAAPLPDRAGA